MMGNDLPQQGGITGNMPYNPAGPRMLPPGPNTAMDIMGAADPTQFMPPPQFDAATDYLTNLGKDNPPLFGPDFSSMSGPDMQGYTPREPLPPPPEMDAGARMRELYKPDTDASDRFNELLRQYPQETKPSWLRRIGAMIVDYTKGSKAGQEFFERPRTEAIEDWKNQVGPAQQSANLERYENVNQRTLAANQIAAELREKAQQAKERNDETNARIRQQRADVYQFKATHPDWKIITPKGGNVIAINPQTQETQLTQWTHVTQQSQFSLEPFVFEAE
jgi:hypothetical protein